jgi:hypothetical protein
MTTTTTTAGAVVDGGESARGFDLATLLCQRRHELEWSAPRPRWNPCAECLELATLANAEALRPVRHRSVRHMCPGCGDDVSRIGVTDLAYTYVVCTCRELATYDHLVEQLWHLACLLRTGGGR